LAKFNPPKKKEKLFEFTLWKKNNPKFSQFLCQKMAKFRLKKKKTLVWALLGSSLCLALPHKMGWPLLAASLGITSSPTTLEKLKWAR